MAGVTTATTTDDCSPVFVDAVVATSIVEFASVVFGVNWMIGML